MVGSSRLSARRLPHKDGHVIREQISGTKGSDAAARPRHSRRSRQMALLANAIAAGRLELRRIHDVALCFHVLLTGAMAALAPDAAFEKRRIEIAVLRLRDCSRAARMTIQARFF